MTTEPEATQAIAQEDLVHAICVATEDVFTTMLNLSVTPGSVFVEKEEAVPSSGVVSLIGLAGSWVGSGSLACSAGFAAKIASALLMTPYEAINEDVLDAVAEVTNMIIGNVKTALENRLGAMGLSTPTVIYGRNFQTRSTGNQEWTVVPFTLGEDCMCVQLCIVPNADAAKKTTRTGFPIPHVLHS
ncbi:MAG TPA: chemotaxis protein CheX [Bryobacteraceae bacterium]|nr:chemotaxis protein CheX [Bryobacteraceae bacterium]